MVRMSVPCSSRWTANACRSECGVIGLGILRNTLGFLTRLLHRVLGDVLARDVARKEPVLRLFHSPPLTQDLQELRREHHVTIFLSFTLLDAQDHALAVDGGESESNGLRDAQARGVTGGQDGAMFPACDAIKKLNDFFRTEDDGQCLRFFRSRDDVVEGPVPS